MPSICVPLGTDGVVRWVDSPRTFAVLERILRKNEAFYASLLDDLSRHTERLFQISLTDPGDPCEPWFEDTASFSHMDAVALYLMIARYQPRRIVEIGSGSATKYMRRAVRDAGLATQLAAIDPNPGAEIEALCDQVVRRSVLDVPVDFFRALGPGDILFLDGSHLVFSGTDAPYLFFEILPLLARGVLIHFHDIFLPEDYPAATEWQSQYYNEQYCLGTFLMHNDQYSVLLPLHYLGGFRPEIIARHLDLRHAPPSDKVCFTHGVSFWLRKSPEPG